jgi:hypothetical protein
VSTTVYTNDPAMEALAAATPLFVDVVPAADVAPHLAAGGVSHAGPPIEPARMCPPMRAALGVAMALEGLGQSPADALRHADAGEVAIVPNHDVGGVGPMAGVVTGTMPVLVARDEASGATAWCPLNEGSGKVLRYGADDDEVVRRLRWMRDVLGPSLHVALSQTGPIDLVDVQARALLRGDECHHRTGAGTTIVRDLLGPHLPDDVSRFIAGNHQFFLNLAMVAAKLAPVCADGVPGSALTTVIARNGVEVGVKLSGTGARWFTGPAALPRPAALYPGYVHGEMNPDLGDSAIVEAYGLGALAIAASPDSATTVGLDPADAEEITARLRAIAAGEHPRMALATSAGRLPAILGIDARAVVREDLPPPVHTGIAHRRPGVGQIGGGITHPPMGAFHAAVRALDGV